MNEHLVTEHYAATAEHLALRPLNGEFMEHGTSCSSFRLPELIGQTFTQDNDDSVEPVYFSTLKDGEELAEVLACLAEFLAVFCLFS